MYHYEGFEPLTPGPDEPSVDQLAILAVIEATVINRDASREDEIVPGFERYLDVVAQVETHLAIAARVEETKNETPIQRELRFRLSKAITEQDRQVILGEFCAEATD